MTKPSSHLDWAVGNPSPSVNIIEPSAAKKISAWAADERPPYEFFNWLFYRQDEWNKYFEQTTDAFQSKYNVIVGSGTDATHATLQDAINDGALGSDIAVLVRDSQAVTATITLSKARWRIYFSPGVVFSKSGVATMFDMSADSIEMHYGRFTGMTAGGDKVVNQTAAATYCNVIGARFGVGTDTEVDQTLVPAGKKGLVSQTLTEV